MNNYFQLQFKLLSRRLTELGIPLIISYALGVAAFILFSYFLFTKTEFAAYLYAGIALSFLAKLSEQSRNDFLKSIFSTRQYLQVRVIENLLVALPFFSFLLFKKEILVALLLALSAVILAVFQNNKSFNFTVPTPFGRRPFEFAVGFRSAFPVFILAYFITGLSIYVGNFNLGLFSLVLIGFVCLIFYTKVEDELTVWNFNRSAAVFLREKLLVGLLHFSFLILPAAIILGIFNGERISIILLVLCLAAIILSAVILGKYSSFPHEMSLPQGILLALCFIVPPLLLIVIPMFYSQSVKRLNHLLND